ncbi:hypothetical protein G7046_g6822 [Stylonectria norvegica]|nr:hypothetical protein G7046_g6822 [Stylonectria norvegica]
MRLAVLLAHLALWTSSTNAFFPYTPTWMETGDSEEKRSISRDARDVRLDIKQRSGQSNQPASVRAAREATRLATKYVGRRRLGRSGVDESLSRRDNAFNIMEADQSGANGTAGLDQDGTDYSYFIEAELGSKGKKMYLLIDTGAGSSWVMSSTCSSKACTMHSTFGPDDSDTLQTSTDPFSIAYGSGKVNGNLVKDTIGVAGMSFLYQFGLATTTSDQFIQFAFDGILGLAMSDGANENFLTTMDEANEVDNNIFCISLNRASDGTNKGEISFGKTNSDKFSGDIGYTPLEDGDDWSIEIDDMSYDGKKADVGGVPSYIDTGTSFIFGPEDKVKNFHSVIPGAQSTDGSTYTVPCDCDKSLTLTFSGVEYEVSSKDWISSKNTAGLCTSNIYGHEVVKGAWLLGDTFLKNVYTVFDKDKKRIGFAKSTTTDGDDSDETTSSDSSSELATKTSSDSKTTSSTDSSTTSDASAIADSEETTKPDMGLGHESIATSTATADAQKASETKDSSSPDGHVQKAKYASIFCIATFFALMV